MKLDLVVFESNPDTSKELTSGLLSELIKLSICNDGVPIIPTGTGTNDFKVYTYPEGVKTLIEFSLRHDLVYGKSYAVSFSKLFSEPFNSDRWWFSLANLISDDVLCGYWLFWGINWNIIDLTCLNAYINSRPSVLEQILKVQRDIGGVTK